MTGIAAMMLSACDANDVVDNTSTAQKDIPQSSRQETHPDRAQSSPDSAQSSADRPQSFATSAQLEPTPDRSSETPQQNSNLSVENTHPATNGITTRPSVPNSTHDNQPTFHHFHAQYLKAKEAYDKALARYNAATSTTKMDERSALELTLAKALNDLADAQTALNTAQEKQASHKTAIDAATQKVESETEKVEAAKNDRQQAIDNAMKALDAKNAEIAQYQETKANAERHLASLGTEKTNLEAQLIRDKEAVKAAEDELNKAQAALRQAQEANADLMAAAQQRLAQAQTALDNAQNTQAEAQQRLNELKGELATAKARLLDAQSEYDAKVSEISTHAADLKKLVNQRDEAVKTAQATLESAQNERYAAEGDLEIAQGFLTSAEAELARLKETSTDELEGNFESATRALEEAKKKVADATSALEEATRTYDAEQAKYERMLEELNNVVDFSALTSSQKMLVVSDMVAAIINQHRLDAGLNALAVNDYHNAKAREWSQILADTKFATEKKEGSQYAGTNEGHTHDARYGSQRCYRFRKRWLRAG